MDSRRAGSVIFNGSNQLHGFRNVGTEPAIYHVVNFKTAATPPGKTEFVGAIRGTYQ